MNVFFFSISLILKVVLQGFWSPHQGTPTLQALHFLNILEIVESLMMPSQGHKMDDSVSPNESVKSSFMAEAISDLNINVGPSFTINFNKLSMNSSKMIFFESES